MNILGMMVANFGNARLLNLMGSERLFYRGAWVLAVSGVAIVGCAWFGWGGLWGLVVPIFFYMSMNGFIVANSVAGALAFFPQRAGSASSLLGAMHYGSGIFSAALVSWLSDGSPKGMALVMGSAGIGCVLAAFISKSTHRAQ